MSVLITGVCGFIGRHFARSLLQSNHEVVGIDNFAPLSGAVRLERWMGGDPRDYKNFKFIEDDCDNYFRNSNEEYELVIHAAALVGGRKVIEEQPIAIAKDISLDVACFDFIVRNRVNRLVYFSSSAAYPLNFQSREVSKVLVESDIDLHSSISQPDLAYGWAKLTGEYLANLVWERYGSNISIYRPFSGYGADQDLAYPFPAIVKRALEHDEGPFNVWGSGMQVRDFVHVSDCVDCVLLTMNKLDASTPLNISTGVPTNFQTLSTEVLTQLGKTGVEILGTSKTPEGAFYRVGDTNLQNFYGFKPKVRLADGIAEAIDFFTMGND